MGSSNVVLGWVFGLWHPTHPGVDVRQPRRVLTGRLHAGVRSVRRCRFEHGDRWRGARPQQQRDLRSSRMLGHGRANGGDDGSRSAGPTILSASGVWARLVTAPHYAPPSTRPSRRLCASPRETAPPPRCSPSTNSSAERQLTSDATGNALDGAIPVVPVRAADGNQSPPPSGLMEDQHPSA